MAWIQRPPKTVLSEEGAGSSRMTNQTGDILWRVLIDSGFYRINMDDDDTVKPKPATQKEYQKLSFKSDYRLMQVKCTA